MAATQITERLIADGSITNAKVKAGAAIATSKLADSGNFILRDGSIAMTGELAMGAQKITGLGTPTTTTDAATKSYVDGLISGLNSIFDGKGSVRAASTANVTISNPGTAVFDGVTLTTGERILLKNQSAPAENGIYVFATSGTAMTRATDFDAWAEIPGGVVTVEEGTANADTIWLSTANAGGTLNTTAITWFQIPTTSSGYTTSNFVDGEVPSGSINGSNTSFTLANTPTAGTVHLYNGGLRMQVGAGNDYTISGATITMLTAPLTGEILIADYRK